MTLVVPALAGLILAAGVGWALVATSLYQSRFALPAIVLVVAAFYPAFAWFDGNLTAQLAHMSALPVFVIFAIAGLFWGPILPLAALVGHGIYDFLIHGHADPSPDWWPVFCGAFDITLAALLAYVIYIRDRPTA